MSINSIQLSSFAVNSLAYMYALPGSRLNSHSLLRQLTHRGKEISTEYDHGDLLIAVTPLAINGATQTVKETVLRAMPFDWLSSLFKREKSRAALTGIAGGFKYLSLIDVTIADQATRLADFIIDSIDGFNLLSPDELKDSNLKLGEISFNNVLLETTVDSGYLLLSTTHVLPDGIAKVETSMIVAAKPEYQDLDMLQTLLPIFMSEIESLVPEQHNLETSF